MVDSPRSVASKEEVERFLARTDLESYQKIELPYGLSTPGRDRSKSASQVFRYPVEGKSVLDVGCKMGFFCHQALARGASRVKGVEIDRQNADIARTVAGLWDREIEVECIDFLDLPDGDPFDVVLFLNVLHHVADPVVSLQKLAMLANELLVVEFSTVLDHQTHLPRALRWLIGKFAREQPLIFLGDRRYHRVWYFSPAAFRNLVLTQLNLFREVEFQRSGQWRNRVVAHCWK